MKKYRNIRAYNKALQQIKHVNLMQVMCLSVAVYKLFKGDFIAAGIFVVVARLFELGLPVTRKNDEDE